MCDTSNPMLFLETLKVVDGSLLHVDFHNRRFNSTRQEFYGSGEDQDLRELIVLPPSVAAGIHKCRVTYGYGIIKIEFEPYSPRVIHSLKLVAHDAIDYRRKYADRSVIDRLYAARGDCDDILIVRNGLVTDTSYANVAFWDGTRWLTPHEPLLRGTCRARLLEEGAMGEEDLRPADLPGFGKIRIFNAMMDQEHDLAGFPIGW